MPRKQLFEEDLSRSVIGAFFTVYNALGYGFLERLCSQALENELRARGHHVGREVPVEVSYEGAVLGVQRLDMVVDHKLVVEVKSTELLHPMAKRQLLNYLRGTSLELGLLLHFGPQPRFHRVIHTNEDRR
jgi:GxxExxY protein